MIDPIVEEVRQFRNEHKPGDTIVVDWEGDKVVFS